MDTKLTTKSTIQFTTPSGIIKKFELYHNIPEEFGLNIECAVENWLIRTRDYSAKSLIDYIQSKQPNVTVLTEEEFKELVAG